MKIHDCGYVPLLIAAFIILCIGTWVRGVRLLREKDSQAALPLATLLRSRDHKPIPMIPGTTVFLTAYPDNAPVALLHSLKHFKTLYEQNVILTVVTADVPRVDAADRIELVDISPKFRRVTMTFGYIEEPNVPLGLTLCRKLGWKFDNMTSSFILSRRSLKLSAKSAMLAWQSAPFIFFARNAAGASDYSRIPAGVWLRLAARPMCNGCKVTRDCLQ